MSCPERSGASLFQTIHYAIFLAQKVNITATSHAELVGARFCPPPNAAFTLKSVNGRIAPHPGHSGTFYNFPEADTGLIVRRRPNTRFNRGLVADTARARSYFGLNPNRTPSPSRRRVRSASSLMGLGRMSMRVELEAQSFRISMMSSPRNEGVCLPQQIPSCRSSATCSACRSSHRRAGWTRDAQNPACENDGSEPSTIQQRYRRDHDPYIPFDGVFAVAVNLRIPPAGFSSLNPHPAETAAFSHLRAKRQRPRRVRLHRRQASNQAMTSKLLVGSNGRRSDLGADRKDEQL